MITNTVLFSFIIGAVSGLVLAGAIAWVKDLGLKMTWWKWLLAIAWYIFLNFSVFLAFTMMGEGEVGAGWKLLLVLAMLAFILGVGLVRLLWAGREKPAG